MPYREFTERLFKAIKDRGLGPALEVVRKAFVNRLQKYIFEPYFRTSEAVDTHGVVQLASLTIQSHNRDDGTGYEASPRQLVHLLNDTLPKDHSNWTFIDVGAGRGRILLEAAMYPYSEVLGIEFARELVDEGRLNIAGSNSEKIKAQSVNLLEADAANFRVPAGPCIFYLFNPFEEKVGKAFLQNVLASYKIDPRKIMFVYLNPRCASVFEELPQLKRNKISLKTALKLYFMVPSKLNIYTLQPTA